jgi:hypothetical protein
MGEKEKKSHQKSAERQRPRADGGIPDFVGRMSTAGDEISNRPNMPDDVRIIIENLYRKAEDPDDKEAKAKLFIYEHLMGVHAREGIVFSMDIDGKTEDVYIQGQYQLHSPQLERGEIDEILDNAIRAYFEIYKGRFHSMIGRFLQDDFKKAEKRTKQKHAKHTNKTTH